MVALDKAIMVVDNRTVLKVVALVVDIVVMLSDLREICQVMDKVEVDLAKDQMLADLKS